jgi:ankyrin repeat protein
MTALHYAAMGGFVECAKMLLDAHVELLNVKADDGDTALDCAVHHKKQAVGEYLRSRGGECNDVKYPADWKDEVVAE